MYFDYLSTTPLDKEVYQKMEPYWLSTFGNPHSDDHIYGYQAAEAIGTAQNELNQLLPLSCQNGQWIYTSGATEANNLALKSLRPILGRNKILVSSIEHPCILETAKYLGDNGFVVEFLPVSNDGVVDLEQYQKQLTDDVLCVSVMWANNETGVIQPIAEIVEAARAKNILTHSDAAQVAGKIALHKSAYFPDMISLSAHKFYGPKGIGALWVRHGLEDKIIPQIHGGGQQQGLRSGTVPVPLVVGMGAAITKALNIIENETERLTLYRDFLETRLKDSFSDLRINGEEAQRLGHVSHFQIPEVEMGNLIAGLPHIALSRGSACGSGQANKVSHVMAAMRMEFFAHECLRVSFGRQTTDEEVEIFVQELIQTAQMIRDGHDFSKQKNNEVG